MTDEAQPAEKKPSLWTRIRNWFWGEPSSPTTKRSPAEPSPPAVSELKRSASPLVVPAEGGSFSFTVHVELIYQSTTLTKAKLAARVNELHESDMATVLRLIWPLGRQHPPHRPDAAEQAMNRILAREKDQWCHDDGAVRCSSILVRVLADERVLVKQLPHWELLIEQDMQERIQRRRIEQVRTLMIEWVMLLESFGDTPIAIQAAALADPDVGRAVAGLAERRRLTEKELVDVLRDARDAHAFVGLYELADSYEVAVRRFEHRVGLRRSVLDSPMFDIHSQDPQENGDPR